MKYKAIYYSILNFIVLIPLFFTFQNCSIKKPGANTSVSHNFSSMSSLNFDPTAGISLNTIIPSYYDSSTKMISTGTEPLVKVSSQEVSNVFMYMNHNASEISAFSANCTTCHTNNNGVADYTNARFHESVYNANLKQPSTCIECHSSNWTAKPDGRNLELAYNSLPLGMVGSRSSLYTTADGIKTPLMMHDALFWNIDPATKLPTRTVNSILTTTMDCNTCHSLPTANAQLMNQQWKGASFHNASTTNLNSCLDCHIADRPSTFNSATLSLDNLNVGPLSGFHTKFGHMSNVTHEILDTALATKSYKSSKPGMLGCQNCHSPNSASGAIPWGDGRFHTGEGINKLGSFLPTSSTNNKALNECSVCHSTERPLTWKTTSQHLPFTDTHAANFIENTVTIPNTTNQLVLNNDCKTCHRPSNSNVIAQGKPSWLETVSFHGSIPESLKHNFSTYNSCRTCHDSQTKNVFFTIDGSGNATRVASTVAGAINHSTTAPYNTSECTNCHLPVLNSNFASLADWSGAMVMSNSGIVKKTVTYDNNTPTGTNAVLTMEMNHGSSVIRNYAAFVNGDGSLNCNTCHNSANGDMVSAGLYIGSFHYSISQLGGGATQPTNSCRDCHNSSAPTQKLLTGMNHSASLLPIAGGTAVIVNSLDCSTCHSNLPTQSLHRASDNTLAANANAFKNVPFHSKIAGIYKPQACTSCHSQDKPTTTKTRVNNSNYNGNLIGAQKFTHSLSSSDCSTCHTGGNFTATSWSKDLTGPTASFHKNQNITANCSSCHVAPTSSVSDGVATYTHSINDTSCQSCHSGTVSKVQNVTTTTLASSIWAGGSGRPHASSGSTSGTTNCVDCHGFGKSAQKRLLVSEANHFGGITNGNTCVSCHKDYSAFKGASSILNYAHTNATANAAGCTTCHKFTGGNIVTLTTTPLFNKTGSQTFSNTISVTGSFNGDSFTSTHTNTNMTNCSACHSYPGTPTAATNIWTFRHRPSNAGLSNSKSSNGCIMCH